MTSYVAPKALVSIPRLAATSQAWGFRGQRRSVRVGSDVHKRRFMRPNAEAVFLEECRAAGITETPSSYGQVYHSLFKHPRPCGSLQAALNESLPGGWQVAAKKGPQTGTWYVYDLKSAYAWAAMQGLPQVRSARPSYAIEPHGLYVATFRKAGIPLIPSHLKPGKFSILSTEEIERYDLQGVSVRSGAVFRRFESIDANLERIRRSFTDWKAIFRSFWGCWASNAPVECSMLAYGQPIKEWTVNRRTFNPVWAAYVLSRVKMRLADYAGEFCHAFVDSVILPRRIPTGTDIGDWKLVEIVNGLTVYGCGNWVGNTDSGIVNKHAGIPSSVADRRLAA